MEKIFLLFIIFYSFPCDLTKLHRVCSVRPDDDDDAMLPRELLCIGIKDYITVRRVKVVLFRQKPPILNTYIFISFDCTCHSKTNTRKLNEVNASSCTDQWVVPEHAANTSSSPCTYIPFFMYSVTAGFLLSQTPTSKQTQIKQLTVRHRVVIFLSNI